MAKPTPKRKIKASARRRKKIRAPVKADKARKPRASIKVKAGAKVRRGARVVKKATRQKFAGGLASQVAKGYKKVREFLTAPTTRRDKATRLAKIGVEPQLAKKKKYTVKQKRRIDSLYAEFGEFARAPRGKFKIIFTKNRTTLRRARGSGIAVWHDRIFVHVARETETVRVRTFMGERVIARTYYGKLERIFLGGADVFNRVVRKLKVKKLRPNQMITGAFFGGPTFHRAIYRDVLEFLNYLNNTFVPHMAKGVKATKRNIARARAQLMKNIAIVEISNPEFEDDGE